MPDTTPSRRRMIVFRVVATLAGIVFLAFNVPFVGAFVAIFAIPIVLALVAYPKTRALLTLARNYDWAANSEHLVNVGLAALLAGMRRPGSRVLTVMVAAVLAFMGAAAISVPSNPGSWGTIGGLSAIVGSIAVLAAAGYAWRRDRVNLDPRRVAAGQSPI